MRASFLENEEIDMSTSFWGKVLRVNLSTGAISTDEYDWKWYRQYLGGWSLVAYTLLNEVPGNADPLGPENKFIFAPGPMTGIKMGGTGRNAVGAKSPLTGGFGESDVGGFWGAELKHAGWDGIIVEGVSGKPVYLWINGDRVEIRDASHLWRKTTGEVEDLLREELGEKRVRITQIGPAGENLALHACVLNDINHAAGRGGLGAVLGSKKLRAIATLGSKDVPVVNRAFFDELRGWVQNLLKEDEEVRLLHLYGMNGYTAMQNEVGGLPTRNFRQGVFEGVDKIEGVRMAETLRVKRDTCYACPIACKQVVKTSDPYHVDPLYGGPEYETVASFGSSCGVDDLDAICKANELCEAYGLDTISVGVTVAWAMEAYEAGLIRKEDTDGIDLRFGNAQAVVQLVEKIGQNEGFGAWLANGAYRCAKDLGSSALDLVVHVKKQEVPMHDPRVKHGLGIGYAISPTGADHVHNILDDVFQSEEAVRSLNSVGIFEPLPFYDLSPAKMRMVKHSIDWAILYNCVGLCICYPFSRKQMAEVVGAATGWDITVMELQEIGERALDMAREFNRRCGSTAADDRLPQRLLEPLEKGPEHGRRIDPEQFRKALMTYYDMMGWGHRTGAPKDWKLFSLGLDWVVEQRKKEKT